MALAPNVGSFGLSELQRERGKKFPEAGRRWGKDLGIGREGLKQSEGELNQYTMKYPSVGACENNDTEIRGEKPGKTDVAAKS